MSHRGLFNTNHRSLSLTTCPAYQPLFSLSSRLRQESNGTFEYAIRFLSQPTGATIRFLSQPTGAMKLQALHIHPPRDHLVCVASRYFSYTATGRVGSFVSLCALSIQTNVLSTNQRSLWDCHAYACVHTCLLDAILHAARV